MAYSQFLQHWAYKLQINIDSGYVGGEMLVCRGVLEALNGWLTHDGHQRVLPAIDILIDNLFALNNEIDTMYSQRQLAEFLQSNIILSIGGLRTNIQQAYSYAFAAGEKESEGDHLAASQHIHSCHDCIQRVLADILIQ